MVVFEWDPKKERQNIAKHGISFTQAKTIFAGPVYTASDTRMDYGETRFKSIGLMESIVAIVVIHTDRSGNSRIISARKANRKERKQYQKFLREQHHDGEIQTP
jgi:uncharacterized DUF497 family protein